jgi:hypothetical protein
MESFTEIVLLNKTMHRHKVKNYARRYGLQSFVCVGADDDDGKQANP